MTQYIGVWADGTRVIWRALTWSEYAQFTQRLRLGAYVGFDIYRTVVVEGPRPEDLPAGIAWFIREHLLDRNAFSGAFLDVKQKLDHSRAQIQSSYLLSAKSLISHLFHYRLEEIDGWDVDTFFQRLAMAELITGKPFEPVPPKEKKDTRGKNLLQQEMAQAAADRRNAPPDESTPRPKKPLSNTQQMALERVRREHK